MVEGGERHQHDVGQDLGRGRRWLRDTEHAERKPVSRRPGAKDERLAARGHRRQRELRALEGELLHQRCRIDLVADGRIA
jgi:hypothetical protein